MIESRKSEGRKGEGDMTQTASTQTDVLEASPARAFTDIVRGWQIEQKGRLAVLRRSAGKPLAQARGVSWIYDLLNRFGGLYGEEAVFLTAALLAFDQPFLENAPYPPQTGSLGRTLAVLKNQSGVKLESLERRFGTLLDADYDPRTGEGGLPPRLRQTVKLVVSKEVGVDWPLLLCDLRDWNDSDKLVQKRWARDFYAPNAPAEEFPGETKETPGESNAN